MKERYVEIYQIASDRDINHIAFEHYVDAQDRLYSDIYDLVWSGSVQADRLDDIYTTFNIHRPSDFYGHSLSVSDVIWLDKDNVYYVDAFGYAAIPSRFDRDKTQKTHICQPQKLIEAMEHLDYHYDELESDNGQIRFKTPGNVLPLYFASNNQIYDYLSGLVVDDPEKQHKIDECLKQAVHPQNENKGRWLSSKNQDQEDNEKQWRPIR